MGGQIALRILSFRAENVMTVSVPVASRITIGMGQAIKVVPNHVIGKCSTHVREGEAHHGRVDRMYISQIGSGL